MSLFCASAASGVGKTHLAYAAGLTGSCISIIIRIAQQREENGKAAFSTPWIALFEQLDRFEKYRKTAANCDKSKIANHAYRYIKLLILCYVHVTHIAIGDTTDDVNICKKCELALRFHRNVRGEALTSNYFNARIAEMQITDEETRLIVINSDAMDNFYAEVKLSSTIDIPCLLCFDEIQTLFDKYSELFLSQQQYLSQKNDEMKSDLDDPVCTTGQRSQDVFELPPISTKERHQHSRGIFYVLCCAMCELAKECEWYMYMTGTSFSMTKFRKTAHDYSPVRGNVKIVAPRALFSLQQMVSTLKHYWNIADSVLENEEVRKALKFCEGRPLLFVNGVFVPLYHECESYNFSGSISESCLLSVMNRGVSDLCSEFSVRMSNVLEGGKAFPLDQSKTSRYFLPYLVKALLFDNGKMVLSDQLGIGEAIATSLVPACADHQNRNIHNEQEIDIYAEPLVGHVLKSVILQELQTGIHDVLKLLIETKLCVGKGDVAEIAFAYNIALLTYQHQVMHNGNGIDFADLVIPMFTADRHLLPELVDQFSCFACRVVDCSDIKRECAFRRFVRDDGAVDDTVILTNLPKRMGADTAFIVSSHSDRADKRVVVAQHKNDTSITLSNVMVTLSPGTQYLSNTQRRELRTKKD
mmetsp:Transcript_16964/g.25580  ORF Transcript_16964/g.25580 Transcript_16964/m.25580 type:complete len:642 (+) Transcript_16964:188-2113(+)|eukprot:CAMPEP_0185035678 /NCGR_PEP_ID=MMETSP1103-20130426/27500_1 /TAXON_ID=36769 /ORGANISM="Paraphysomonas bandaiensis, Strain Caron Lab Isolate" /LENGTH=641 /DNA_ID=CAMNT_0027572881 /DNA_START=185 /DNA_END=2110 /DNA_ORIENTATION=-